MTRARLLAALLLLSATAAVLGQAPPAQGATFTVNTILDPGIAGCDAIECSLREAIDAANTSPGPDIITFNVPGSGTQTITPLSALPEITAPVTIDGATQPGFMSQPLVVIDGGSAGAGVDGLRISGGGSIVRSLVINDFSDDGIELSGNGGNRIDGSRIGTDPAGLADLGSDDRGVVINGSPNNFIGGTTTAARNIISGNTLGGVTITGAGATGNQVLGNYIGVDANGGQALVNNGDGVEILGGASTNTIGGTAAGSRNVISDNPTGINISGTTTSGNIIQGNYLGPDPTGTVEYFTQNYGVFVFDAPNTIIGGSATGAGNLISGNQSAGIWLYEDGTAGTVIQGNLIGPNAAGTGNLGNSTGIEVGGPVGLVTNTTIGGTSSGAGNVISGNGSSGIWVRFSSDNTLIGGNLIGTTITGNAALGNSNGGIVVNGTDATIGGTSPGARNVISGNPLESGVTIAGSGATGAVIQGNYLGTNITGTADLGNSRSGVRINGAPGVVIGGSTPGAGNLISGNNRDGIEINAASAIGTVVRGNIIGLNAAGTAAIGNTQQGVNSNGAFGSIIGGAGAGQGNLISGNGMNGILIGGVAETNCAGGFDDDFDGLLNEGCPQVGLTPESGSQCTNTVDDGGDFSINDGCPVASGGDNITGNTIGTDATGTLDLGNLQDGIRISSVAGTTVGGIASGAGNLIFANDSDGVEVNGAPARTNTIRGNSIHSNTLLGIENSSGGNTELSPPLITSVDPAVGTACANCTVDVYSDAAGEGRVYEGSTLANGGGAWSYPAGVVGPNVTATATSAGNTSEFAPPVACVDTESDTVCDSGDNCPSTVNPGQENAVHPGTPAGDHCEDPDADSVLDITDNCPDTANLGQENIVHPITFIGDHCEDPDADTVFDLTDNCPDTANVDQDDADGDGDGDACDPDDDNDGSIDTIDQVACGGDPFDGSKVPERIDGVYAGQDDDADTLVDEPLPPGSQNLDCDGDNYTGSVEDHVFDPLTQRDQDPCGTDAWPADFVSGTPLNSTNRVNLPDLQSYILPTRRLTTSPGDTDFNVRWDLVPGATFPFAKHINLADMQRLAIFTLPPMFGGGTRAFNGPFCPWTP